MTRKELLDRFYIKAFQHYGHSSLEGSLEKLLIDLVDIVPPEGYEVIVPKVFLLGEINWGDDSCAGTVIEQLEAYHKLLDPGVPIELTISSGGGDVDIGVVIQKTIGRIRREGREVHGHVAGIAASMAFLILQNCDVRTAEPTSCLMLHEYQLNSCGSSSQTQVIAGMSKKLEKVQLQVLADRTGVPVKFYTDRINNGKEWWLTAEEALKEGFIDRIEAVPELPKVSNITPRTPRTRKKKAPES